MVMRLFLGLDVGAGVRVGSLGMGNTRTFPLLRRSRLVWTCLMLAASPLLGSQPATAQFICGQAGTGSDAGADASGGNNFACGINANASATPGSIPKNT